MQHEFWHEKWQNNQIGFHLPQVNKLLLSTGLLWGDGWDGAGALVR